ncbi:hypothetical protein H4R33_004632 [Dimargaris cristalligena]|uniref:Uncharacterized protein n=1 Tax=Dimargaris cristalligena TaxID=215637 RepID=A0A4P9ZL83_9FUNG|nr:hypothetical protein H4R33_004632 [Dimargaris cristalligena]RKP34027.1 hypothetical protein BJ085DRAFT_38417 [Dimargaris cristalligena]|eukprot:RKP34027.1 hypothetical protein BJ085DRAFT_38417 [Dimargaris cristalligena]
MSTNFMSQPRGLDWLRYLVLSLTGLHLIYVILYVAGNFLNPHIAPVVVGLLRVGAILFFLIGVYHRQPVIVLIYLGFLILNTLATVVFALVNLRALRDPDMGEIICDSGDMPGFTAFQCDGMGALVLKVFWILRIIEWAWAGILMILLVVYYCQIVAMPRERIKSTASMEIPLTQSRQSSGLTAIEVKSYP